MKWCWNATICSIVCFCEQFNYVALPSCIGLNTIIVNVLSSKVNNDRARLIIVHANNSFAPFFTLIYGNIFMRDHAKGPLRVNILAWLIVSFLFNQHNLIFHTRLLSSNSYLFECSLSVWIYEFHVSHTRSWNSRKRNITKTKIQLLRFITKYGHVPM